MQNLHANDLPAFLDPLLNYLAQQLPENVYHTLETLLSHFIAIVSAGYTLLSALPSWKPWEWDAQTVLPPLITILAAYYALLNVYRTTAWMIRASFWAAKWGTILSIIFAGLGWMAGNVDGSVAGLAQRLFNGSGQKSARNVPVTSRSRAGRPRPWDSFEAHRQWQYRENVQNDADDHAGQTVAQQMMAAALRTLDGTSLLSVAKSVVGSIVSSDWSTGKDEARSDRSDGYAKDRQEKSQPATGKQSRRKAKAKASNPSR